MRLFQKAQSMLEYCVLIVVIAAGVIIMSPYVIRSTNTYFKSWEDAADDSFNDPLVKAPEAGLPMVSCSCDANFSDQGCGTGGCAETSRHYKRFCSPVGCPCQDLSSPPPGHSPPHTDTDCEECLAESTCCTPWVSAGSCGDSPCAGSQKPMTRTCGVTGTTTQCVADPSCQQLICQGTPPDNATICPEAGEDQPSIPTFYSLVSQCTAATKCEYTCNSGFMVQNGVCVSNPCPDGQAPCYAVTKRGTYGPDTWDKDEVCGGDDICDPAHHFCTNKVCDNNGLCGSNRLCGLFTGHGWDVQTATTDATNQVNSNCPSHNTNTCDNKCKPAGCSPCDWDGNTNLGQAGRNREAGTTGYLCVTTEGSTTFTCNPVGGSCP